MDGGASGLIALWLILAAASPTRAVAAELERLEGHAVQLAPDGSGYAILDVAGEGAPRVGIIERRGAALVLVGDDGVAHRLMGPLARPRIAGPGYKVWVLGSMEGDTLVARRLGVLAPPAAAAAASAANVTSR